MQHCSSSEAAIESLHLDERPCRWLDPPLARAIAWRAQPSPGCGLRSLDKMFLILVNSAVGQLVIL